MEIIAAGDIWQIKESARFEIGEKEADIKFHQLEKRDIQIGFEIKHCG